jgi:hypothetical protein
MTPAICQHVFQESDHVNCADYSQKKNWFMIVDGTEDTD